MSIQKTNVLDQSSYTAQRKITGYKQTYGLASEKNLIDTLQIDLKNGFNNLVQYYNPYLRKIIQDIVYPDYIDDVTQETFLRAYRALKKYSPERIRTLKLLPWLRMIAKNTAINQYIECRDEEEIFLSIELIESSGRQLFVDAFNPVGESADSTATIKNAMLTAEHYLKSHHHPERNKQIWMRHLQNHSQRTIAREVDCSPAVVGYVIHELQRYIRKENQSEHY